MEDIKIKTHTTHAYETSDGREFENKQEAIVWQQALEDCNDITMLDSEFNPTNDISSAFYLHIKTYFELKAFEIIQKHEGFSAGIPDLGCWYYDDISDCYVNINEEIDRLNDIINKLHSCEK